MKDNIRKGASPDGDLAGRKGGSPGLYAGSQGKGGRDQFFKEFELPGKFLVLGNRLLYNESLKNYFDAGRVIGKIVEKLKGEGTAWVTYKCEEDGREAYAGHEKLT